MAQHTITRCAYNQGVTYTEAQRVKAGELGWVRIGQWCQTIDKCEVPTAVFDDTVMQDGEIRSHEYAREWVMRIVKCTGPSSAIRASVVRRMFADTEERKFFDTCMRLQKDGKGMRGLIRQMACRIYSDDDGIEF